ncbi:transposase, partial [Mycobacterium tuberculosis 2100HD]
MTAENPGRSRRTLVG